MQITVIQRILGLLLMVFSTTMLPSVVVSWWYQDGAANAFLVAFLAILGGGMLLVAPVFKQRRELRLRDGFLVVVLFWLVLGFTGAVPLALSHHPQLSITDAVFESFSGLTTTGATVIVGLDDLPKSILWYRQQLQWLGGMGIIVLAVAVLALLGIGGMQLYRAETPGPMKDSKLTPRIAETAKALWYIYLSLTIACALAYWAAGMGSFDAITHAFSTVGIGGFSTHDASIGYFNSPAIELVAVVFMVLSGANFSLHYVAWQKHSLAPYGADPEFRAYGLILLVVALITAGYLSIVHIFSEIGENLHHGIFQAVSFGTTTGFTTAQYHQWPRFLPVLLLFTSFIGGCAGSTGGGLKVIRVLLLVKQGVREIGRLIHPDAIISVRIGRRAMDYRVMDAVWGFFATYIAAFSVMMLLLMASGLDQVTAFSAVAAAMNNLGPGLGDVASNYQGINDFAKWVLCFAMLLGRLEVFTVLVILSPVFWRS